MSVSIVKITAFAKTDRPNVHANSRMRYTQAVRNQLSNVMAKIPPNPNLIPAVEPAYTNEYQDSTIDERRHTPQDSLTNDQHLELSVYPETHQSALYPQTRTAVTAPKDTNSTSSIEGVYVDMPLEELKRLVDLDNAKKARESLITPGTRQLDAYHAACRARKAKLEEQRLAIRALKYSSRTGQAVTHEDQEFAQWVSEQRKQFDAWIEAERLKRGVSAPMDKSEKMARLEALQKERALLLMTVPSFADFYVARS